jgi:GNAT superfamily N-acetyltransferase
MGLEIRPVASRRDRRTFIRLPGPIYRNEPHWVPPLLRDERRRLDPGTNPFFEHADVLLLLAWRDGEPVGRISAHVDHNFNRFQDNDWGLFGFFECAEDPEAANALFDAAAQWLAARGRDRMVGPMDFTTNDTCGVLIESVDRPPLMLCPYTRDYYPGLYEGAGLGKAMDLYMWELKVTERDNVHPAIWEVSAKVESEHGIVCRQMNKHDLTAEVERFLEVYNAAWERNWGFVPLTDNEVRYFAKELRPVLDENWAYIAQKRDGEVVGAALTLPDYNQVLKELDGRLLPLGWLKALRARRRIDQVRVFALGVKPEYRHTGVAARFYEMHFDAAERTGVWGGEMGWILESNTAMNRAMEGMGGKIVRRYRLYERPLSPVPEAGVDSPS